MENVKHGGPLTREDLVAALREIANEWDGDEDDAAFAEFLADRLEGVR